MKGRFRVKTRDGREIETHSLEALVELIRMGEVGPEDLVFDSVTSEWAPARSHSMVRLVVEPADDEDEGEDGAGAVVSEPPVDEEMGVPSFDLVEPHVASPEEETETLIAELEEERESDADRAPLAFSEGAARVPGSDSTLVLEPERRDRGAVSPLEPVPHKRISAARRTPPPPRRDRLRRDWAFAGVLPLLALGVSATVARPAFRLEAPGAHDEATETTPRPVPASEEQVRAAAFTSFLSYVEALGATFDFGAVPDDWLEGWYLAQPSAYPAVRDFWEQYRSFAQTARAEEGRLYRQAYLESAEEAGVTGPVQTLRMAAALEDFEARGVDRAVHYDQVLELADAALALHRQLIEVEGQISYEPARGQQLSADPVIEAAGRDPETQARLEAALDRVVRAVYGSGAEGMRDRSHLAQWLVEGLAAYAPPVTSEPDVP